MHGLMHAYMLWSLCASSLSVMMDDLVDKAYHPRGNGPNSCVTMLFSISIVVTVFKGCNATESAMFSVGQ